MFHRKDQLMSDSENDELNRQLCAVATEEVFEFWSSEVQQQVLAEWNDWQQEPVKRSCHSREHCGKEFTRSTNLKRHIRRVHTALNVVKISPREII